MPERCFVLSGLLKAIPEASPPYGTLEEVVKGKAAGSQCRLPVTFTSLSEVTLAGVTLEAGAVLTLLSVAEKEQRCRCRLHPAGPGRPQAEAEVEVDVPLGTRGQFYERFTPREIVTSTHLRSRRFRFHDDDDDAAAAACQRTLVLSPVYQICAIMSRERFSGCPTHVWRGGGEWGEATVDDAVPTPLLFQ